MWDKFFIFVLLIGCLVLGMSTYVYKDKASACELTEQQLFEFEQAKRKIHNSKLLIDSLNKRISQLESVKPGIINLIEQGKDNRDEEITRLKSSAPSERDKFWTDYFTRQDTITWRQLDSLQY